MSNFFKRVILFLFVCSFLFSYSQDTNDNSSLDSDAVETDSDDSSELDADEKYKPDYNTWAIGGGFSNLSLQGDLRSTDTYSGDAYTNLGLYLYGNRMFNPIIGMEVRFNLSYIGGESQLLVDTGGPSVDNYYRVLYAEAYRSRPLEVRGRAYGFETSLIVNLDNLWKRHSKKWSWAGHLGVGFHRYDSRLLIKDYVVGDPSPIYSLNLVEEDGTIKGADFGYNKEDKRDNKGNASSAYLNAGLGLKYRLNSKLDLEVRVVLNLNNEDHLDAAIQQKQIYETFYTGNVGIVYKFGKKEKYAIWVQDKDEVYNEAFVMIDTDDDGVEDEMDKEINTPRGAEVYGSGIAIDSDKDGIKDYEDDCPLVPGIVELNGCPDLDEIEEEPFVPVVVEIKEKEKKEIAAKISLLSKAIYFKTDKDELKPESYKPLNQISDVMFDYPASKFKIEGNTDSRGKDSYNLSLSKRRSSTVYRYLTDRGVEHNRLSSEGYGETKPIASNDTEAGRQMNRRVEINYIDPDSEEGKIYYAEDVVIKRVNARSVGGVAYSGAPMVPAVDSDGDGVTDMYDKEPNTPKESRVYGNGVSIDSDMDAIPDYRDDCPFVKGPVDRNGCPIASPVTTTSNQSIVAVTPEPIVQPKAEVAVVTPIVQPKAEVAVVIPKIESDEEVAVVTPIVENEEEPIIMPKVKKVVVPKAPKKYIRSIESELKVLASEIKFARSEGHILKSNNIFVLQQMGYLINEYEIGSISIEVHTTNKPNLQYNLGLSKRRAYAIQKELTENSGIPASRLNVVGLGGEKPKYDNNKDEKYKNNRVELKVD